MLFKERGVGLRHIITAGIISVLLLWFVVLTVGQNAVGQEVTTGSEIHEIEMSQDLEPVFSNYRGIAIGTAEAELLERINTKPRFESEDDYFYVFSHAESAQFLLDEERKVKMISIMYSGSDFSGFPTREDVFGNDVATKTMADHINYSNDGFWVGYYRSSGETPLVIITIQKL